MDQGIEQNRLNWVTEYLRHLEGQNDQSGARGMADLMRARDNFLPPALGSFEEGDLEKLLVLRQKLNEEAFRINYYLYYLQIVEKLLILLAEQYSAKFDQLPPEKKDNLFGIKSALPDEIALYEEVYAYLLGHRELGELTFPTGLTLQDLLERMQQDEPEALDERLLKLIVAADDQYQTYFRNNFRSGAELPPNY
jgi:hypothetical protein